MFSFTQLVAVKYGPDPAVCTCLQAFHSPLTLGARHENAADFGDGLYLVYLRAFRGYFSAFMHYFARGKSGGI